MKVGFLQLYPKFGDKETNFKQVERLLAGVDADLIVLPEFFATGYSFVDKQELSKYAESFPDGATIQFMKELSRRGDFALVGGFPEQESANFYNSSAFVTPTGETYLYRKVHLFDKEKLYFQPGNLPFKPVDYMGVKVGLVICFDWIFPESYRTLALRGAQIICHSTNLVLPFCQKATVTRCVENRVFIILANRYGVERRGGDELKFTGQSEIVAPNGKILARANEASDAVQVVEIEPKHALDKNVTTLNDVLNDRRPEYYER